MMIDKLRHTKPRLVIDNTRQKLVMAAQSHPATLESEFDEGNPNCRAVFLAIDNDDRQGK